MAIEFAPLASYVLATIFSPGPNNLYSATLGINQGYKRTLPFLIGVCSGYFFLMVLCAFVSNQFIQLFPAVQHYLGYLAAAYIMWLAWSVLKSELKGDEDAQPLTAPFVKGALLQLINPKAIIFGLTLFSTLLASLREQPTWLVITAATLSSITFIAVSMWTLFGAAARKTLANPNAKRYVKWTLIALLLYTAASLVTTNM